MLQVANCPDLKEFDQDKVTMGDLLLKLIDVSNTYYECKGSVLKNQEK